MINWDFELEKWRRKWRTINGGPSSTASPHFWPVEWEGKDHITPSTRKSEPGAAAFTNHGQWLPDSRAPGKSPGSEAGQALRVLDYKESLLCTPLSNLSFIALDPLKTSARAEKFRSQRPTIPRDWHRRGLTEKPLSTFSSTATNGKQLDNISPF